MGGSSLFAEVCRNLFGVAEGAVDVTVLDTTDPTAIRAHQTRCPVERLCVIISSKSGTTSEVRALSLSFYALFTHATSRPGDHCLVITDEGTPLAAQATAWNVRRLFLLGPETGMDVGGRFSALTSFGLVPAALLGIDLDTLLARAIEMLEACAPSGACPADASSGPSVTQPASPLSASPQSPALQLAAVLASIASSGRGKLALLVSSALESFGTWVEQLLAESLGKSGKGLVPIVGEPLCDPHRYDGDWVCIELQLASEPDRDIERQVQALVDAGRTVVRIRWQDRYDLGGEIIKWELATALAGSLMRVNPFDELNVNESKERTKALLSLAQRKGRLEHETPFLRGEGMELFGAPGSTSQGHRWAHATQRVSQTPEAQRNDVEANDAQASGVSGRLPEVLARFLTQRAEDEYCAILSFLPRTRALDMALHMMRQRLATQRGMITMLGFGPRYLHSTGQLYKGGADAGIFLMLTAEESSDLDIPGEPYTFGLLKQAQALGDFQAMRQRNRRILRIHLGRDPERSMPRLLHALDEAMTLLATS
jgi:hypothetical protein